MIGLLKCLSVLMNPWVFLGLMIAAVIAILCVKGK